MNEDLMNRLRESIEKSGFPTEMKVANTFINNRWKVEHSNYYIDLDENKGREIDIIANIPFMRTEERYKEFVIYYVTEVKREDNKPWVVFTSPTSIMEKRLGLPYHLISNQDSKRDFIKVLDKFSHKLHSRIGRTAFEGFGNGKDKLYSSLCNTIKAMEYFIASSLATTDKSEDQLIDLYEPLIVLEGNLIEAFLDEDENLQLEEQDYLQVKFNYKSPGYNNRIEKSKIYIINIVRSSYLDTYLKQRIIEYENVFHEL